jgi:hypothetical protein
MTSGEALATITSTRKQETTTSGEALAMTTSEVGQVQTFCVVEMETTESLETSESAWRRRLQQITSTSTEVLAMTFFSAKHLLWTSTSSATKATITSVVASKMTTC